MPEVSSIVLFSARADRTIAFYRSVGIQFEEEDHGDGVVHAATDVGDFHFAIFAAADSEVTPGWRVGGSTFIGFYVDSLDATIKALTSIDVKVLADHEVRDWGCRVVVEDPDGRAVEINQRAHCRDADVADTPGRTSVEVRS